MDSQPLKTGTGHFTLDEQKMAGPVYDQDKLRKIDRTSLPVCREDLESALEPIPFTKR
jgi:hypothetical protein